MTGSSKRNAFKRTLYLKGMTVSQSTVGKDIHAALLF